MPILGNLILFGLGQEFILIKLQGTNSMTNFNKEGFKRMFFINSEVLTDFNGTNR